MKSSLLFYSFMLQRERERGVGPNPCDRFTDSVGFCLRIFWSCDFKGLSVIIAGSWTATMPAYIKIVGATTASLTVDYKTWQSKGKRCRKSRWKVSTRFFSLQAPKRGC